MHLSVKKVIVNVFIMSQTFLCQK